MYYEKCKKIPCCSMSIYNPGRTSLIMISLELRGEISLHFMCVQGTKKFRPDSPGLEDFVVRLVPDGQGKVFRKIYLEIN